MNQEEYQLTKPLDEYFYNEFMKEYKKDNGEEISSREFFEISGEIRKRIMDHIESMHKEILVDLVDAIGYKRRMGYFDLFTKEDE